MAMYGSAIVVGTYGEGVFYQNADNLPDSSWINAGLEGKNVTAVYPHKSGPLMWGIAVGVRPEEGDSDFVYCGFVSEGLEPNSAGISDSLAEGVYRLAGFPDPTICGEKYAATGGALYRQWWGDSLWTPVYESLGIEGMGVIYVRTRENIGGFVLAGGSEGFTGILLIKSTDYGDTWEHLYPPGPAVAFDFDVDSTYSDLGTIFVSHGKEISRSIDGGMTWEIVLDTGGCNYVDEIVYDPLYGRICVAGGDCLDTTSAILFCSEDLGASWMQVPLSFGGPIVGIELSWDGYLYLAAPWSGVYRIDLDDLSIDESHLPLSFALYQNYPNPFNVTTTIRFDLPEVVDVELVIYDILGREVRKWQWQEQEAGRHVITWDARDVASGIFFYRLNSEDRQLTRKLVVLK